VAEGAIDGYLDCADSNHGPWDYLGGMLVLLEAGGVITDLRDRPLVVDDHEARRAPVAAATTELHAALVAAERGMR
jgi:fructose-1,6-bisphosphatase/inositol monophosphatase family enzyme